MKTDRLTAFLYLLNRDHLASGVIEKLLVIVEEMIDPTYSCPHNAALAAEWTDRLRSSPPSRGLPIDPPRLDRGDQVIVTVPPTGREERGTVIEDHGGLVIVDIKGVEWKMHPRQVRLANE